MLPGLFDRTNGHLALAYRKAGLDLSATPEIITRAQALAAFNASARMLGDDAFSLTCARAADPIRLGLLGTALTSGATLRHCLENLTRALPAFQADATTDLSVAGEEALIRHRLAGGDPQSAGFLYEAVAAFLVQSIRKLMGPGWNPSGVQFPHRRPARVQPFEEFFRAPVLFEMGDAGLIRLPAVELEMRVKALSPKDAVRWDGLATATRELESFELTGARLVAACENIIDYMLASGKVSLPAAAQSLGLTVRSMQRLLSLADTSFQALTEQRRRAKAMEYLVNPDLNIADVALALGYSDSAHFIRAFKKWHGVPPSTLLRAAEGPSVDAVIARMAARAR
jgi:AraC-like DNA-binding protein